MDNPWNKTGMSLEEANEVFRKFGYPHEVAGRINSERIRESETKRYDLYTLGLMLAFLVILFQPY